MPKGISSFAIMIVVIGIIVAVIVSLQYFQPEDSLNTPGNIPEPEETPITEPSPSIQETQQETEIQSPPAKPVQMDCGNEIGNGNQIVSGPSGPEGPDRDNPFRSLTVHPTNPDVILLGTERNGFVKSEDGGITWSRYRYGVRHAPEVYTEIYDVGIAASNPDIIYAVTTLGGPGPLTGNYPSSGGGVYKSIDGGVTWERKNCGIHNNGGRTTALYVDPNDGNHAIIGISAGTTSWFSGDVQQGQFFSGGLYSTTDGGENWEKIDAKESDYKSGYSYILAAKSNPSLLYTFGFADDPDSNAGFLKSTDNGKTWQQFASELKNFHISHFDISSDGKTIYAIQDDQDTRQIHKSTDGGETWTSQNLGSSGYTITVSPVDSGRVLFGKTDGLYLSTDGVATNKKVLDNNGESISDVVFAPSNPDTVHVVTHGYTLYKSTDAGETFTKVKDIRNEVLNVIP